MHAGMCFLNETNDEYRPYLPLMALEECNCIYLLSHQLNIFYCQFGHILPVESCQKRYLSFGQL